MKMRYSKSIIVVLVMVGSLVVLSSCHMTKRYKTPEVEERDNLFRDGFGDDTTSIAKMSWREFYQDLTLQGYIEEALENNHDMLIASERIRQAEVILGQARSEYYPDVALSAQVEHLRLSSVDPTSMEVRDRDVLAYHKEDYSLGIVASWELDLWGKMRRKSKARYADMLNSYAGRNLVQTSLISNVANMYYSILALDEQLAVTNSMIALMERTLETTEALKEAGMTTAAAVEQTRAMLHSTKTSVPELVSSIAQLENGLSLMMGREPGDVGRSVLKNQSVDESLRYGVPAQMLALRPDVAQAELNFRSTFELTNAARASFYPSIKLTAGMFGLSAVNTLKDFFKPENIIASIAGGLTQPLFARKQLKTQLELAKGDERIALINFERAVLNAGREVSDFITIYESSLCKNEDREIEVVAQRKSVDYTQELLRAGEATYIEVLSAQQGLLQAELKQVGDKLQQLQAMSDLYRALGGGTY